MSLRSKILIFVSVACFFCTGAAVFVAKGRFQADLEAKQIEKSEAILTRVESARKYVANQGLFQEQLKKVTKEYPDGKLPEDAKITLLNTVPIYAALKIGSDDAKKDHYKFRVATKNPRRAENEATQEELEFYNKFEEDPSLKQQVYMNEKENEVWVMRPVRLSENDGCLSCHGHPSTSPWKNGKDVLGFQMENWKDGYMHGMFVVKTDLGPVDAAVKAASTNMFGWAAGLLAIAVFAMILFLRKPINTLDGITRKLKAASEEGFVSSKSLGDAAQAVSASTSEQAAGIQETMASMAEMNSMISKTLDLAKQTQDMTASLDQKSKSGTSTMQGMVHSMETIKQSNEELKKMVQIINDISTKTNVINEIVFKTQLLSVNASIEAARAGQHGKGFAVVAEEVGNLAQVSGKAAEEIRDMLTRSQAHVQEVVAQTNDRVSEGERVSQEAMKAFVEISEGISRIQTYSQNVSEATTQQQEGISQISAAMDQMDKASQQNSEMAGKVSGLSEGMVAQAEDLRNVSTETLELVYGENHKLKPEAPAQKPPSKPNAKPSHESKDVGGVAARIREKVAKTKKPLSNGNGLHADSDDFKAA